MNTPTAPFAWASTSGAHYSPFGRARIVAENPPTAITIITREQRRAAKAKRKTERAARRHNRKP